VQHLRMPTDAAARVFSAAIANYRDEDLKSRLTAATSLIAAAEESYRHAGQAKTLHAVPAAAAVGAVSVAEMTAVYDRKFVPKREAGRHYYEKLKSGARAGKCPLCGQRPVGTLDHHLAKAKHPALAVTPINLVPACSDCNFIKLDLSELTDLEQTLHPYFDDVEKVPWLVGAVVEGEPPAVVFDAQPPETLDTRLASRVKFHFKTFKLARLYAVEAAGELAGMKAHMKKVRESKGPAAVRDHLLDAWGSRRAYQINSWQTAFYKALADSQWYCETVGT
jgi:hypothetical protein